MRIVLAVALCLVLSACGNSAGPKETHLGTYGLRLLNGESLPGAVVDTLGYKIEVLAQTLELMSGGIFETVTTSRPTRLGEVSTGTGTWKGQYTLEGKVMTFAYDAAPEEPMAGTLV